MTPRAVDEDIYRPELLSSARHERFDLFPIRDVGDRDQALHLAFEPGLHLAKLVLPACRERHVYAFARQRAGHRRPDAAGGSYHHRDPALQRFRIHTELLP